jgi:hypothetical protein
MATIACCEYVQQILQQFKYIEKIQRDKPAINRKKLTLK